MPNSYLSYLFLKEIPKHLFSPAHGFATRPAPEEKYSIREEAVREGTGSLVMVRETRTTAGVSHTGAGLGNLVT